MARVAVENITWTIKGADLNTRRVVDKAVRQNGKLRGMAKRRARYALFSLPCVLCLLPLCWNVEEDHPARGQFGHTLGLTLWACTNWLTVRGQHKCCNEAAARAGYHDLREWVEGGTPWPSREATERWERTPNARRMVQNLPTAAECEAARADRGLPF